MSPGTPYNLDRVLSGSTFDLVHVQTPFAAHYASLRFARQRGLPCLAPYHTHFEEYLFHYVPVLPRAWPETFIVTSQAPAMLDPLWRRTQREWI
jgi:hypothetical protein